MEKLQKEPQEKEPRGERLVDARSLVAVCALSLSTFVQNGYLYPPFALDAPWMFTLCGVVYALAFAVWAFIAQRSARPLPIARLSGVLAVVLVLGTAAWCAADAAGRPVWGMIGASTLLSLGRSWTVIVVGLSLAAVRPRGVLVTVSLGVGLSYVVLLVLDPLLVLAAPVVYALLPLAALAAVAHRVDATRRLAGVPAGSPSELALTNPASFPSPGNRLFVCIALFEVAFGFSIEFGDARTSWWHGAATGLALLAVALWCVRTRRRSREDALFHMSGVLVVFGFFVSGATGAFVGGLSQGALAVGAQAFNVLTWATLAIIAARNPAGGIVALAQGFCASGAGVALGVALGQLPVDVNPAWADARLLVLALVAAGFFAYVWLGLKNFSFSDAIQGVRAVEEAVPPAPETAIEERCAHLARVHSLTEREGEVFALLARGRNGAFIQQECRVTRNTAKTHIRRIYQKLNVHTQQELIDLVESSHDYLSV